MENKEEFCHVEVPLHNFECQEEVSFLFSDNIRIARVHKWLQQDRFSDNLSESERSELEGVSHWLQFTVQGDDSQTGRITTTFLLSLWLAIHSRTHAKYRFEIAGQKQCFVRLLDRFQWVEPYVEDNIDTRHLEEAALYFQATNKTWETRRRLWHSLVLTSAGCMAKRWQVAIICFTAALEGILTYSKQPGITERLSSSFACLTKSKTKERDAAYKEFYEVYDFRSDIMHGRIKNVSKTERLLMVNQASNVLRSLWRQVLSSVSELAELENDDSGRESFFNKICKGYATPKT